MSSQLTLPMPTLDDGLPYADLEGRTLADFTTAEQHAQLRELAGPWPIRWLFPPSRATVTAP